MSHSAQKMNQFWSTAFSTNRLIILALCAYGIGSSRIAIAQQDLSDTKDHQLNSKQHDVKLDLEQATTTQQSPQSQQQADKERELLPCPFTQLTKDQSDDLNQLLESWESASNKRHFLACDCEQWRYGGILGPKQDVKGERLFQTYSCGEIKFKAPYDVYFSLDQTWEYSSRLEPAEPPYEAAGIKRKWILEGTNLYEFDFSNRQLIKSALSPAAKRWFADGQMWFFDETRHLAFLFMVEKENLLNRFWLRDITPKAQQNEYWIAAYPKDLEDARNFSKIEIILDKESLFVRATRIYSAKFDAVKNPKYKVFRFSNPIAYEQESITDSELKSFEQFFCIPKLERGWTTIRVN